MNRTLSRRDERITIDHPTPDHAAVLAYSVDLLARFEDGWSEVAVDDQFTRNTYDSGRLQSCGMTVDDNSVGSWFHFNDKGGLRRRNEYSDSGTWLSTVYYRDDGSLQEVQDNAKHDDERIYIDCYGDDGKTLWRRGTWASSTNWDGNSCLVNHGALEIFKDGSLKETKHYDFGAETHPPGEREIDTSKVVSAFKKSSVKAKIEDFGYFGKDRFRAIEAALQKGEISLDGEMAYQWQIRCFDRDRPTFAHLLAQHATGLLPVLEREAASLVVEDYPDADKIGAVSLLWLALDPKVFGKPANQKLLLKTCDRWSELWAGKIPTINALRPALDALPDEVREQAAITKYDRVRWVWAKSAVTPKVVATALGEIAKMKRNEFTYGKDRQRALLEMLGGWGANTVEMVVSQWNEGGKKHPQRELYALVLARAGSPAAVPVLLEMANDSLETVRDYAAEGLAALATDEELTVAAKSKKKKIRETIARALVLKSGGVDEEATPAAELRAKAAEVDLEALETRLGNVVDSYYRSKLIRELAMRTPELVAIVADRHLAGLEEGNDPGKPFGVGFQDWGWAKQVEDPAVAHLAAEVMISAWEANKASTRYSAKDVFEHLGETFPLALASQMANANLEPKQLKDLYAWWVEATPATGTAAFVFGLGHKSKPVRESSVQGLIAGKPDVAAVLPALTESKDAVIGAARVLGALADAAAISALEASLSSAKGKVAEALQEALGACKLANPATGDDGQVAEVDYEAMDGSLASRKVRGLPKGFTIPAVSWKDGSPMSEGARKWLVATLKKEDAKTESAELKSIRGHLDDQSCEDLAAAISAAIVADSKTKWVRYARGVLGNEENMDKLGKTLQQEVWRQSAAWAGHGVEVLRRSGCPSAIRWLDHWACNAKTNKLGKDTRTALNSMAQAADVTSEVLVDTAFIGLAGAEEAIQSRLEGAMITGRRWPAELFSSFVLGTGQANDLVGAVYGEEDKVQTLFLVSEAPVDGDGKPVELAGQVGIPHPVELTDAQIATWSKLAKKAHFEQLSRKFTRDPRAASKALYENKKIKTRTLLSRGEALGLQAGNPQDAGIVYDLWRRVGSWRITFSHEGVSAGNYSNPNGPTLEIHSVSFRSDADSWSPTTDGLASEAHQDLLVLLK